ncbi:unnamed protein product, partial [Ectocarpus fasciculatus]
MWEQHLVAKYCRDITPRFFTPPSYTMYIRPYARIFGRLGIPSVHDFTGTLHNHRTAAEGQLPQQVPQNLVTSGTGKNPSSRGDRTCSNSLGIIDLPVGRE